MKVAVLALQGAFIEHKKMMESLGAECVEIRQKKDLDQPFSGLLLPGGESTVIGKLLKELDLFDELKSRIENGLPVFGTCAGLILLAQRLSNDEHVYFGTLPVTVKRNAYGRQLGSFHITARMKEVGEIPMTFIRAPYIESAEEEKGVKILAEVDGKIVAVRYENQLAISFHPEVTKDSSVHRYFLEMAEQYEQEQGILNMKKMKVVSA